MQKLQRPKREEKRRVVRSVLRSVLVSRPSGTLDPKLVMKRVNGDMLSPLASSSDLLPKLNGLSVDELQAVSNI